MDGTVWEAACCLCKRFPLVHGSASPDANELMRSVIENMQESSESIRIVLDGTAPSEQHNGIRNISQAEKPALRNIFRRMNNVTPMTQPKGTPARLPAIISDHEVLVVIEESQERKKENKQLSAKGDRTTVRCDAILNYFGSHWVKELTDPSLPLLTCLPKNVLGDHLRSFCWGLEAALRQVSPVDLGPARDEASKLLDTQCWSLRVEYLKAKEKLTLTQQRRLENFRLEAEVYVKERQRTAYSDLLKHKLSWGALIRTPALENTGVEMEEGLKLHCQEEFDHTLRKLGRLQEKAIADVMVSKIEALKMGEEILSPLRFWLLLWEALLGAESSSLQQLLHAATTAHKELFEEIQRFGRVTDPLKACASTSVLQRQHDCAVQLTRALAESKIDVLKFLSVFRAECTDEIRLANEIGVLGGLLEVVSSFETGEAWASHEQSQKLMEATLTRWNYIRNQLGRPELQANRLSSRTAIIHSAGDKSYFDSLDGSSS
ncbi:hypothetical protein RvY_18867 [Ramazzottius varieornatus]|uniref:Uncharacterized protein n=1 Tax=Ramazzottius varieornatus TaxID=947166 RepID=A0A1D1W7C2_RAMVA|nr:hypothetical protein RvY_18867 [Ramazzottius varieornatus]